MKRGPFGSHKGALARGMLPGSYGDLIRTSTSAGRSALPAYRRALLTLQGCHGHVGPAQVVEVQYHDLAVLKLELVPSQFLDLERRAHLFDACIRPGRSSIEECSPKRPTSDNREIDGGHVQRGC